MSEQSLINSCLENYADDQPRLVYAAWLADEGRDLESEFVRKQVELHRLQCVSPFSGQLLKKQPKSAASLDKEVKKLYKAILKPYAINANLVGGIYFRRGLPDSLHIGIVDQCKTDEQLAYIETCLEQFAFVREVWIEERTFYKNTELFEKFLKLLPRLPFLHKISIDDEEISETVVKHLGKCKRLFHIDCLVGDGKLDKVRTQIVKRFRKLTQEEKEQTRLLVIPSLWSGDLMASGNTFNPKMDLHQSFLYDSDAVFFESIEEIKELNASDSRFTKEALKSFATLPNLETIELNRSNVRDFSPLIKAKKLKRVLIDDRNFEPDEASILRLVSKNESIQEILIDRYNDKLREAVLKLRPNIKMVG